MHEIKSPYLLFLGHGNNPLAIKTSRGIGHWCPQKCVGEYGTELTLGFEKMGPYEAVSLGAKTFILGLTNTTGRISAEWKPAIFEAIDAGMDIASGLHQRLSDLDDIRTAAEKQNVLLHDIRHQFGELPIATGAKRSGHRILTIGTDCSVGKMYTALSIEREMKKCGYNANFRATGQTGIFIAGQGIPVDAVVADFIAGSVEKLCPANMDDHWDIIEGQGSLFNPAYAGVSLGLLHGAQADILVMCHEAERLFIKDKSGYPIPDMQDCIQTNLKMAQITNPNTKLGGIALNCRLVGPDKADRLCKALSEEFSVPCFDPMIHGVSRFIQTL